ncbi:hypothetical protein NDU88_004900 [Pleurodeles waltl]|uniref:Uncharacterized protein n=1 Tax=Pleurodeles waltl TaxID=8319 RepID=A0AAV7W6A8_PLEWA|nr:hypothetical protein NDU88_004900 [Pleurodeles waltl]
MEATENAISTIRPSVTVTTSHIKALQKEALHLRQQVWPVKRAGSNGESVQALAEVEHLAGTPSLPPASREQLDVDVPDLDGEQINVLLGGDPPVTPQTAEVLL